MRNDVLAIYDLLEYGGEDDAAVHVEIDAFELGKSDEVGPHEDAELPALHLALLTLPR